MARRESTLDEDDPNQDGEDARSGGSTVMYGEPHRRRRTIGPLHAVPSAGRDVDIVAGAEAAFHRFVFKAKPGGTRQNHHPLGSILRQPIARRRRLSRGDDPLDA